MKLGSRKENRGMGQGMGEWRRELREQGRELGNGAGNWGSGAGNWGAEQTIGEWRRELGNGAGNRGAEHEIGEWRMELGSGKVNWGVGQGIGKWRRELGSREGKWGVEKGIGEQRRELGEELPQPHLQMLCSAPGPAQGQTDKRDRQMDTALERRELPAAPPNGSNFFVETREWGTAGSPQPLLLPQAGGEGVDQLPKAVPGSERGHKAFPGKWERAGMGGMSDEAELPKLNQNFPSQPAQTSPPLTPGDRLEGRRRGTISSQPLQPPIIPAALPGLIPGP